MKSSIRRWRSNENRRVPSRRNPRKRPKRSLWRERQGQMAKVLLAEDDSTMVSLLKTLLDMEGFEVLALDVNSDVPAVVQREKPHALFMDVHLGGQSGMEILDTIRRQKELSDVRIVMTSGLNVKDECINRGANAFLLKPFMPDDLIRVLKQ